MAVEEICGAVTATGTGPSCRRAGRPSDVWCDACHRNQAVTPVESIVNEMFHRGRPMTKIEEIEAASRSCGNPSRHVKQHRQWIL